MSQTNRPSVAFVPIVLSAMLAACLTYSAAAKPWPQWRGQLLNGVSQETGAPLEWSATKNVVWKAALPGQGGSTPVVWEKRLFLTSAAEQEIVLLCFSNEGEELWRRSLSVGDRAIRGDEGNMASPSPMTDGKHVWAMAGTGDLACYTVEGSPVWKLDLEDRYGKLDIQFGMASTPVLHQGKLYLQLIHGDGDPNTQEAVVVCLDGATGTEVWQVERPSDAHHECEHSYASPTIYQDAQHELLLTHGGDYVVAHHLEDGKELWRCGGLNPPGSYNPTFRFVASPVSGEGIIVVPTAKKGPVVALRPGGSGDIKDSAEFILWKMPRNTPDVPSPLILDGLVYLCRENGNLICLDATTGKQLYEERTVRDRHRASPLAVDGKIYLTSRKGLVTVIKPGRKFEILSQNEVDEPIASSPVFADGTLYLRTYESLIAIRASERAR